MGRTPKITYRRRKQKRPSKGTEGGFNSLTLNGDEREEETRSNGPSDEIGKDNLQSWEGQWTGTTTIKGRTPTATGAVRNWERLPRGEEELSKGPRIPVLPGATLTIQDISLVLTHSLTDPELRVKGGVGYAVDRVGASTMTLLDTSPITGKGVDTSTSSDVPRDPERLQPAVLEHLLPTL